MPTADEHVLKARGNERFSLTISPSDQASIDWTLIALFYAAVHYVEAYFAKHLNVHLRSHTTRDKYIVRDPDLRQIWAPYSHLKHYAYNARYEFAGFTAQSIHDARQYLDQIKAHLQPLI